jgi:hypothetical protein
MYTQFDKDVAVDIRNDKELLMRMFWTIFFLGSMLLVGLDVRARRQSTTPNLTAPVADGDPTGFPTPKP